MQLLDKKSPTMQSPSTPVKRTTRDALSHRPLNSSPLAIVPAAPRARSPSSSSPTSIPFTFTSPSSNRTHTPATDTITRRRANYKSRVFSTPRVPSSPSVFSSSVPAAQSSSSAFMRERFRARCLERAIEARSQAVDRRRWQRRGGESASGKGRGAYSSDLSSDDPTDEFMDEDGDEDEDDDAIMGDELFRRIVDNAKRTARHAYNVSFEHDVGSSLDPDIELSRWEEEDDTNRNLQQEEFGISPEDLEREELAAYIEEHEALEDFEDVWDSIFTEDLAALSETDFALGGEQRQEELGGVSRGEDDGMDITS